MRINPDCEICGGSGVIRLPVHGPMKATTSNKFESLPIREYSCPECGFKVPQERIMICQAEDLIDADIKEPDYLDYCRHHISMRLADFIYKEGLIDFRKGPKIDEYRWRNQYALRGVLGVISPRQVKTFEERVKEKQTLFANLVIDEASKQIRNYGSFCNWQEINKDVAVNFLFEALRKITEDKP